MLRGKREGVGGHGSSACERLEVETQLKEGKGLIWSTRKEGDSTRGLLAGYPYRGKGSSQKKTAGAVLEMDGRHFH